MAANGALNYLGAINLAAMFAVFANAKYFTTLQSRDQIATTVLSATQNEPTIKSVVNEVVNGIAKSRIPGTHT